MTDLTPIMTLTPPTYLDNIAHMEQDSPNVADTLLFEENMTLALILKDKGNSLFKVKKYKEAILE